MDRAPDPLHWLAAGVPLSLLFDLFVGMPHSHEIYQEEPGDAGWLTPVTHAA